MSSSIFELKPCEFSDMAECVDVFDEAFATNPYFIHFHPRSDQKILKENDLKLYEKSYEQDWVKYFKIVDEGTGFVRFPFHAYFNVPRVN
jgi:hypothetical protein